MNLLIKVIQRDLFEGFGAPEPPQRNLSLLRM
ncbi:hypothetical protein EXW72_19610 [Pseudomonas sp. BCA14]|nr:hypothetical protein EXW70_18380 [Pseudomonas sp. JMN1]TFF08428.1 hypothetical protein EXW71_18980 [Pseudomonas sp. BCA17]TFF24091.1 hypothetical protein EXW72_19610 [Pseudomonas sp. BCA14]TFF28342.1 hypothetical protein EXW73_12610 [Pseudomonas sp. BCA13]